MIEEKIIETKTCRFCSASFDITDKDLEFYDKISPVFPRETGLEKFLIPSPTLCPDCRQQRRLSFRNERNLYKRKCDLTGKDIISIYSPDKPYKVYEQSEWWSDKWNPLDYGPADGIDFERSFFEQFEELMKEMPIISRISGNNNENCDYINYGTRLKDSYLIFTCEDSSNSYYGNYIIKSNNCIDVYNCFLSDNIYESLNIKECSNVFFSNNCKNSHNIYFSKNCSGCSYCFGCSNLINKDYYIFNKESSKEEFDKYILKLSSFISTDFNLMDYPVCALNNQNTENCSGDYILNSKECFFSYDIDSCRNCKYTYQTFAAEDCYDTVIWGGNSSLLYESQCVGNNSFNLCFCFNGVTKSSNIFYSSACQSCSNLFGCIGLRNAQYCILNKQYTKEEYESLVPRIIEHMTHSTSSGGQSEWGEFFPSSISPFGYNETVAMEYYPIENHPDLRSTLFDKEVEDKENRLNNDKNFSNPPSFTKEGQPQAGVIPSRFKWSTYENPAPIVSKTIPASKLPDNIKDIPDDILNWAILPDEDVGNEYFRSEDDGRNEDGCRNACLRSLQKPFRIIKQELEFYRKHNLPIPRRHPDQRHLDRMKLRNPRKLYDRLCDKCGIEIKTTYNLERPEIVYCESCYNKDVI